MSKKASELTDAEEKRAKQIFQTSNVVDCLTYGPRMAQRDYLTTMRDAGVATHFSVMDHADNLIQALEHIADWHEMVLENDAIIARTPQDFTTAKELNRPCLIMGSQNPKPFEESLSNVRILHELGLRIVQLAYNSPNYIGTGGSEPDSGVTEYGKEVIKEMNRVGILIDVSHCGDKTVMDAIKYSEKPIAITHANPRDLVDRTRNKTKEQMLALAESGGVFGLTAWSNISMVEEGVRPHLEDFLDMMEYVINLIGIDHVGFGLDLTPHWDWAPDDYYNEFRRLYPNLSVDRVEDRTVEGLHHVSEIHNISRGLVARGYSDDDISKVLGGNFINLFDKVWSNN